MKIEDLKGEDVFDIEKQYQKYLERMNLSESKMHPIQRGETKRAFMGGFGQMLMVLQNDVHDYSDDDAANRLAKMIDDIGAFFTQEQTKHKKWLNSLN